VALGTRVGLDVWEKRKAFGPCQVLNLNSCCQACSIVTLLTDWALKEVAYMWNMLTWLRIGLW
jgi:hypothetical protein